MNKICIVLYLIVNIIYNVYSDDVLGCGGFIKSHVQIDFSKVEVKLLTKQGILKDKTNCAPNGYYFVPLYDKGEYTLQLEPPAGWSFEPTKINLNIDGVTDLCSKGSDINFIFKGFGITGKVESSGSNLDGNGPEGVEVILTGNNDKRTTVSDNKGNFFFTPVYPGSYTVSISHPKWRILKKSIDVKVTEGNTDLPSNSLVIQGYDVIGKVKSGNQPMTDVTVVLYQKDGEPNIQVDGCITEEIKGLNLKLKQLCFVKSNENGVFKFGTLPNGRYIILPSVQGRNFFIEPSTIEFTVNHNSVELQEHFEVVGFTVFGSVLNTENGKPLRYATILLNGIPITHTDKDGNYKLEKIKAGRYKLHAEAEGVKFEGTIVQVSPNSDKLPTLYPNLFHVCGKVLSEKSQMVVFTKIGTKIESKSITDINTKEFCTYLHRGTYDVEVSVSENNKEKGLQFFPIKHTIVVESDDIERIIFSQLKATVTGKVNCMRPKDCDSLTLTLKPLNEDQKTLEIKLTGNTYSVSDIFPGSYEIKINKNKLCWKSEKQLIKINTATLTVPPFEHNGYSVNFDSSHETKLLFKVPDQKGLSSFDLNRGKSHFCVDKPGIYSFEIDSCHIFESKTYPFNTDSNLLEIILHAVKHKHQLAIEAEENYGDIQVSIKIDGKTHSETLSYNKGKYHIELLLSRKEEVVIVPKSEILYFVPPIISISGTSDCTDLGTKFTAVKGRVFKGKVAPPLAGVVITVENGNSETLTVETSDDGSYKFPALDDSLTYKVTATKETYVIVGPDSQGNFKAHKLAEIIVDVLDESDNSPLQGALLSLSGGESYRSNLQTNENGRITFHSLSPSDYFLRPMMKEYKFEPVSKIINVKEGQSVNVKLTGKRVAYSVFGQVTSLNGEPEDNMVVLAVGAGNCAHFSEETISEASGQFRIRGLQPSCSYDIKVQSNNEKNVVDRSVPNVIHVDNVNQDIKDLKIIVFKPVATTDILVKVFSNNPEYYKTLRIKVQKDSSIVLNHKIRAVYLKITKTENPGILVHIPSLPQDGKSYSIQLDSTLQEKWKSDIITFNTNSSFKYVELNFSVKSASTEQHIKQTSVWTLVFIFSAIFALYNIELVVPIVKEKFNLNLTGLVSWLPNTNNKKSVDTFDSSEIDQQVQFINSTVKRKTKPKKI